LNSFALFSDTFAANSEFMYQVCVFVSPTWSFSRIESQVLFHSIRKYQQILQRVAYKFPNYRELPSGTLSKFPLSTRIPFCDGPVLDNIFVLFRYSKYSLCVVSVLQQIHPYAHLVLEKLCVRSVLGKKFGIHLVLWAKPCVHLVLGKTLNSSGTRKGLHSSDTGKKELCVHLVLGKKKSVFIWY